MYRCELTEGAQMAHLHHIGVVAVIGFGYRSSGVLPDDIRSSFS
jgi:hypothetical protein